MRIRTALSSIRSKSCRLLPRWPASRLGEADLLRRAVSKKKREVLDEERAHFVQGSLKQGYTEDEANRVYDMIVRFADYGFPRAHAAAYGVLAFQTAYLKAHYPGSVHGVDAGIGDGQSAEDGGICR